MRLIDANVIDFTCTYNGDCMADKEKCKKCEYYVCSFSDIQNLPTAYDVDKIMEQLTQESIKTLGITETQFAMDKGEYSSYCSLSLYDAIDIVRGDY